jgi:hypothetical protein
VVYLRSLLLLVLLLALSSVARSQDRCAITYLQKLQNRPKDADRKFEEWIQKLGQTKAQGGAAAQRRSAYVIPVVVHVIHNGDNDETNIPDEQIESQIRVLNADFNRQNADANQTPAMFAGVAGSLNIQFVLAKRTPEGIATNGIMRVQGPKTTWRASDNYQLKSLSYWPAEDYLNIWVCNLEDYLGYAQFPQTTLVDGLENASTNRLTDGVVINYTAFGSIEDGNFNLDTKYNKGRTTTHEVGHFFGLRHIWGDDDGDCGNEGDYVSDTPDQAGQTFNCPSHPQSSCSTTKMFQNYLDYTNDGCMNLFTQGQADRMSIIIENSPRRKSLLESNGDLPPDPVANDVGIRAIVSPASRICDGTSVIPEVEIRNYGNNVITSVEVELLINNVSVESTAYSGSLDELSSVTLQFSTVSIGTGSTKFTFRITGTNGTADGNGLNDELIQNVIVPEAVDPPLFEPFTGLPQNWQTTNPDQLITWDLADTPIGGSPNTSLMMNFYDYEDQEGEIDIITTPSINLTEVQEAILTFSVAHARYQQSNDGLKVILLEECDSDINNGVVLYDKAGSALATTSSSNNAFKPVSSSAWRTEVLNLSAYAGQRIQLAFVGVNDWGNNLYIDNIRVVTDALPDLVLTEITNPSPATCSRQTSPRIKVRNSGSTVSSFTLRYTVNGVAMTYEAVSTIESSAEAEISLPPVTLADGENELTFEITDVDGLADVNPEDNTKTIYTGFTQQTTTVPFREDFESDAEGNWLVISPNLGIEWDSRSVANNRSVVHAGFSNTVIGNEAWVVSPTFDLSNSEDATLFFDLSYALRNTITDRLEIRASTGCDLPFDQELASYSGNALSQKTSSTEWVPGTEDWDRSRSVSLSDLVGEKNVRIAFVAVNNNGNNLYLDNIELFLGRSFEKVPVEGLYSIYPNPNTSLAPTMVSFNLAEPLPVEIDVIDGTGKIVSHTSFTNVLNQNIPLELTDVPNGLYLARVSIDGKSYVTRFILSR